MGICQGNKTKWIPLEFRNASAMTKIINNKGVKKASKLTKISLFGKTYRLSEKDMEEVIKMLQGLIGEIEDEEEDKELEANEEELHDEKEDDEDIEDQIKERESRKANYHVLDFVQGTAHPNQKSGDSLLERIGCRD